MRKIILWLLISLFIILLIIGCGKNKPADNQNINSNVNINNSNLNNTNATALFILWNQSSPGLNTNNINAASNIEIKFSNPLTTEGLSASSVQFGNYHTAGLPLSGNIGISLSENNTKIILSGMIGWSSAETESDPPFQVNLISNGSIKDIYGNRLATGEIVANYFLEEELWRYLPDSKYPIIRFEWNRIQATDPYGIETWEAVPSTYSGFVSYEITAYEGNNNNTVWGKISTSPYIFNSGNSNIQFYPYSLGNVNLNNQTAPIVLRKPTFIGDNWINEVYIDSELVTFEMEVVARKNIDIPLQNGIPAYIVRIRKESPSSPQVNFMKLYFAYNKGVIKYITTKTPGIWTRTAEVTQVEQY